MAACCLQAELRDQLLRLREELTAALSEGAGSGHVEVQPAVVEPSHNMPGESGASRHGHSAKSGCT